MLCMIMDFLGFFQYQEDYNIKYILVGESCLINSLSLHPSDECCSLYLSSGGLLLLVHLSLHLTLHLFKKNLKYSLSVLSAAMPHKYRKKESFQLSVTTGAVNRSPFPPKWIRDPFVRKQLQVRVCVVWQPEGTGSSGICSYYWK